MRKYNYSQSQQKAQAGGTMLGLIFGLIIGLAIAVVVAILITKTPSPFNSKSTKPEKASDIITTPEQLSDPNKPLYGNRGAPKEIAPTTAIPPSATSPQEYPGFNSGKPAEPPDLIGQKILEKQQEAKAPIVDRSALDKAAADKAKKAAAEIAATKTESVNDNWIYYLQVGAFRDAAEAENARARLALLGFEASISERSSDTGSLYRVRIGSFSSLETMNRMRGRLSDNGVNAAVVRSAR
ncbi:MAG: SPOR domain-containing protein [Glaciimonas sp.]|nr:SPOR domain-containing protein [Glaciimonas sp.]